MKQMPCEVYSRVCGFFRPVQQYNPGKKEEFKDRLPYSMDKIMKAIEADEQKTS